MYSVPSVCTTWYIPAMSRRHTVIGHAVSAAPPSAVYAVLHDRPRWPEWSALGRYEFVSGTEGALGSVCTFVTNGIHSVERLVELVPDRRLSYELVSGLPMRNYRADVDLEPSVGGTAIAWTSSFEAKVPGTAWLFRLMMRTLVGRMARELAAAAVRA